MLEISGIVQQHSNASTLHWCKVQYTYSPADWMPADKPTELSRIKLNTWTRQPVPMISKHSAHSTCQLAFAPGSGDICIFVVVNFDALAQASDIRIERRHVVFLCWMQDSKVSDTYSSADWMLADKPTELSRIEYRSGHGGVGVLLSGPKMTSSNGDIFHVTGPLWGESTGHWWIPLTKANDVKLWFFFICAWTNDWIDNRDAGDLRLRRNHAHNEGTVMLPLDYIYIYIYIYRPTAITPSLNTMMCALNSLALVPHWVWNSTCIAYIHSFGHWMCLVSCSCTCIARFR